MYTYNLPPKATGKGAKESKGSILKYYQSVTQLSSVAQSCPTLCDPMDCSTSGLPVHHQLLEFTQIHVNWVSDASHPTISSFVGPFSSCLRSFSASGSFPFSQFFTACGQSTGVSASASALPMNIQDWFPLGWTGLISLQSKGLYLFMSKKYYATVAAKSLESCPTLCDPKDGSPPGFPIPGILQTRTLEWVAISFSKKYYRHG